MSDFKPFRVQQVEFIYPRFDQLYRYDPTFKRDNGKRGKSVPANADEPNANWSVGLNLDEKRGKALYKKCEEHFKACQPDQKFGGVWGYKEVQTDDGLRLHFTIKRKAKNKRGEYVEAPAIQADAKGNSLENLSIRSGSKGDAYFGMHPAFNSRENDGKGAEGISLYFQRLVVWDPQYGSEDFEDLDGVASTLDVDLPFDDEVPF